MTWLRRVRPALIVLGVVLLVGTLVGAGALTAGHGTGAEAPKSANPAPPASTKAAGPITMGTVDSDPPPVAYGLPTVLQSGSVAEVFVKDGQEITKAGEKLYAFDTSIQSRDLERAKAAVAVAKTKVDEAKEGAKQHAQKVKVSALAVANAKRKVELQNDLVTLVQSQVMDGLKRSGKPEVEWPTLLKVNESYYKAHVDFTTAEAERDLRVLELSALQAADPQVLVREAEAGVMQAEAEVDKANTAIELCTVKARTPGTIEQVRISPGATLGISTREPALWLIPAGPRVVRAEIEADFAHRVSADLIGREVTIYDNTDPKITYKGIVRRVGGTFLPKRSESMIPSDTRVLEAVVEVADPAPAGKPPLRVGQRVRVNLGQ